MHRRPGWWPLADRGSGVLALRRRVVFASCWVLRVILSEEISSFPGSFLPSKRRGWAVSLKPGVSSSLSPDELAEMVSFRVLSGSTGKRLFSSLGFGPLLVSGLESTGSAGARAQAVNTHRCAHPEADYQDPRMTPFPRHRQGCSELGHLK